MTLSKSTPRTPLHTRSIVLTGYRRTDKLWDIEALLTDIKTYDMNRGSDYAPILAGTPLHDMHIRLTLDDTLLIRAIELTFNKFPLPVCPSIAPNYQSLVGLRIGSGWRETIKNKFGGIAGCTHLTEMLSALATVAMQTIGHALSVDEPVSKEPKTRPKRIGGCHAWATDSEAVKRYAPEYYTGRGD